MSNTEEEIRSALEQNATLVGALHSLEQKLRGLRETPEFQGGKYHPAILPVYAAAIQGMGQALLQRREDNFTDVVFAACDTANSKGSAEANKHQDKLFDIACTANARSIKGIRDTLLENQPPITAGTNNSPDWFYNFLGATLLEMAGTYRPTPEEAPTMERYTEAPHILFMDDTRNVLTTCTEFMKRTYGATVEKAEFCHQGIDLFTQAPDRYHAVLTDLNQRQKTGVDVVRAVAELRPLTPVWIITGGTDDPKLMTEARAAAGYRILGKPVSKAGLAPVVQSAVNYKALVDEIVAYSRQG